MNDKTKANSFDPTTRLSNLDDGSQYMGARERLLWFLAEQDEYTVASQLERFTNASAVVKVTVAVGNKKRVEALGSATTSGDYRAVETAETHALARALALLGYGTESALELDTKSVADSPAIPTGPSSGGTNGKTPGNGHEHNVQDLPAWADLADLADGKAATPESAEVEQGCGRHEEAQTTKGDEKSILTLICSDCQGPIKEGKTRDGTQLTAGEVAERARIRFDRNLCARCLTRQMLQKTPEEVKVN